MTYQRPGVYISERLLPAPIASSGTANAAGAVIAPFEKGPNTVTLVTSWYDFSKKFGGYNAAFPATFNVAQFFRNGGTELYVRRVLGTSSASALIILQNTASTPVTIGTFTAKNPGADGNNLRVQVEAAAESGYYNVSVYEEAGEDDTLVELWQNVVFSSATSSDYLSTVLNLSAYVSFTQTNTSPGTPSSALLALASGANGSAPTASDFESAVADYTPLDRPLVMFSPGASAAIYDELIPWVEENNSFLVIDTPSDQIVSSAVSYAGDFEATAFAGVYYPNIFIQDPLGRSSAALKKIGPSGSVAGIILATDRTVGPFKSPAGVRTGIVGAVAPEKALTSAELDTLNSASQPVNAIRSLPGAGTVVYGARTLLQDGTANKYVGMRRSLNYLRKRISDLTQFAVFENNNETLWRQVRTILNVFLNEYRNQGGLRGAIPSDAFFVKCDAENNTATSIANGEVNIEVGVALEYPAEFVVITLSQKTIS
jgi:phage tail sheath protein FI